MSRQFSGPSVSNELEMSIGKEIPWNENNKNWIFFQSQKENFINFPFLQISLRLTVGYKGLWENNEIH